MDANGRTRLALQVTSGGTPSLTFLDANGKLLNRLAPGAPN
jgi:hypothetical protein